MKSVNTILALGYGQPPMGYYPPPVEAGYAPPPQPYYQPVYTPPPAYPPRRPMKPIGPYLPAIVLALVGMILLILSLATPWYNISVTYRTYDYDEESYRSSTSTSDISFGGIESYSSGSSNSSTWSEYKDSNNGKAALSVVYGVTESLIVIALIMTILAFVAAILRWAGFIPALANRGSTFLGFGILLGIVAIVAFAGAHAPALKSDMANTTGKGPWDGFIGTDTTTEGDSGDDHPTQRSSTWLPNIGWFLSIATMVVLGIAIAKSGRLPLVPSQAPPGYGAPYPSGGYPLSPPPEPPAYNPPPGFHQPPPY